MYNCHTVSSETVLINKRKTYRQEKYNNQSLVCLQLYSFYDLPRKSNRQIGVTRCNGPRVVQRKDRQKKEFHDQSDYRQWCMLLMSSTNLSSHTGRHNKQFFSQCSGERQNIFEKLQYHPAPHTPNGNIHPHISSFIHYSFR